MTPERFFNTIRRRSLIVWCVIAVGLALIYSLRGLVPASYAGISHVVLVADNGARDPSVSIVDLPSIATSTVVLQRVRTANRLPVSLIDLKKNVSAKVLGKSSIMEIGYRDESAERAIDVSNSIAGELSHYYDEISTQRYDVNVDRLSSELGNEAVKLRALDAQMTKVASKNPFVISDKSVDNLTAQVGVLEDQQAQALGRLQSDEALATTSLPNPVLAKTARHEVLTGDPTYQGARSAVARDGAQLFSDSTTYTPSFPGLPGEVAKVATDKTALTREASRALRDPDAFSQTAASAAADHQRAVAVVAGDQAQLSQINDLLATTKARLDEVPGTGGTYSQLAAQRAALQTEYAALATRRANALADRAEASSLGSVVVLDRAIKADTQLAGGRTRAAAVALILVVALAFGSAFLVESLDPRIRRRDELEELYGIPVVASFGHKA